MVVQRLAGRITERLRIKHEDESTEVGIKSEGYFFTLLTLFASSMFMSIRADPLGKKEGTTEGTK